MFTLTPGSASVLSLEEEVRITNTVYHTDTNEFRVGRIHLGESGGRPNG
jgi:hypothetical protein